MGRQNPNQDSKTAKILPFRSPENRQRTIVAAKIEAVLIVKDFYKSLRISAK
jgi:hypothetical protein